MAWVSAIGRTLVTSCGYGLEGRDFEFSKPLAQSRRSTLPSFESVIDRTHNGVAVIEPDFQPQGLHQRVGLPFA